MRQNRSSIGRIVIQPPSNVVPVCEPPMQRIYLLDDIEAQAGTLLVVENRPASSCR